jgi:hypothetical protein
MPIHISRSNSEVKKQGFLRVGVIIDGRRTSVSLDLLLAELLVEAVGSPVALAEWVNAQANRLSHVRQASGTRRRIKAGLSRLVQREALMVIARPELLPERRKEVATEPARTVDAEN